MSFQLDLLEGGVPGIETEGSEESMVHDDGEQSNSQSDMSDSSSVSVTLSGLAGATASSTTLVADAPRDACAAFDEIDAPKLVDEERSAAW